MSLGLILQMLTKYAIFPIIVRDFPLPAPATTSVANSSDKTTLLWCSSKGYPLILSSNNNFFLNSLIYFSLCFSIKLFMFL